MMHQFFVLDGGGLDRLLMGQARPLLESRPWLSPWCHATPPYRPRHYSTAVNLTLGATAHCLLPPGPSPLHFHIQLCYFTCDRFWAPIFQFFVRRIFASRFILFYIQLAITLNYKCAYTRLQYTKFRFNNSFFSRLFTIFDMIVPFFLLFH